MLEQLGTTQPPTLAGDWTTYAYTDGSCVQGPEGTRIGAACYAHANAVRGDPHLHCTEVEWRIDPTTADRWEPHVMQAELTALYCAIYLGYKHIMTDSMSALHTITRMTHSPHGMREHRYRTLLHAIFQLIANSKTPIHLYKFSSHVGVAGNEKADTLATQIAQGNSGDNTALILQLVDIQGEWQKLPSSNSRDGMLWPHHQPRGRDTDAQPGQTAATGPIGHLANMAAALRAATRQTLQLGWSDHRTAYWSGWKAQLPKMHPVTFEFMKNTGFVPWAVRRAALQYRTGTLYTGKAAKRMGYAKTDQCMAGCGQPDGIHHAVSGCSKLEPQRTKRHNAAALRLARALQHNTIGATLHSADVGSAHDCAEAGLRCGAVRNIGDDVLPDNISQQERNRLASQCPDMVWVQ